MPKGIVASGHERVSAAAGAILRAGGNAFDAAIAAGFAAAVAETALTSLGGGGFLLARTVQGQEILFDFFVDTPGRGLAKSEREPHFLPVTVKFLDSEQIFNIGLGSIAVPGNLRGFLHVQRRLGRLPLAEVLSPAIALARDGLALSAWQAYLLKLLEPITTLMPTSRALFAPQGRYLQAGDHFADPHLAAFLESLLEDGEREFYEGELAARMVQDMQGQGLLTAADLAAYRVIERQPLRAAYRDYHLLTNPLPSFGGSLIALSLSLLGAADTRHIDFASAEHLQLLVATLEAVARQRNDYLAASLAKLPSSSSGTTHVSVCDAEGNVASMTTSNGEGSGYIVPATGIMLNNMMGEDDLHPGGFHANPPGIRVASMMSPSLLLRDNRVELALGSGGSKRIRTAITQVISNIVDFGMDVRAAVEAPRLHWDEGTVQIEPDFPAEAIAALKQRWPVNVWRGRDIYFGGVHAVAPAGSGAGDPRRGGHAMELS